MVITAGRGAADEPGAGTDLSGVGCLAMGYGSVSDLSGVGELKIG